MGLQKPYALWRTAEYPMIRLAVTNVLILAAIPWVCLGLIATSPYWLWRAIFHNRAERLNVQRKTTGDALERLARWQINQRIKEDRKQSRKRK